MFRMVKMSRFDENKDDYDKEDVVDDEFEDVLSLKESVSGKIGVVPSPIKIHYPCTNVLLVKMHPPLSSSSLSPQILF